MKVEERIQKEGRFKIARDAMEQKQRDLMTEAGKRSVYYTGAADAGVAVLHDIQAQRARLAVGAQEEYSVTQSAFSSLFGGIGAGAQIVAGKFKGKSGLESAPNSNLTDFVEEVLEEIVKAPVKKKSKRRK